MNDVDVFIALTEVQRQIMIRAGLPETKIVLKPHFVPDPGVRDSKPSESDTVLYAGRLSAEKGVRLLIEAWRKAAIDDLELVIAGDGPERAALESDLPAGVRMVGQLSPNELSQLMLKARAMVMPSLWYEGLPRALLEAFAAGLPCAVSDGGGPAEIVSSTIGSDWVFPVGDRSALALKLSAMENDEWCNVASLLARQAFETSYDWSQAAGRLVEIYDRAASAAASDQ
jgi:glycosyltransferase involved in cell wall biosynthesis